MLQSTFQHLDGIGVRKEHELWNSGILTWSDLETKNDFQMSMFDDEIRSTDSRSILIDSRIAFNKRDLDFFARRLSRSEHYRIALSFPSDVLFLDIETTGLSKYYDTVTVVGWSIDGKHNIYVKGDDEGILRAALAQAKALVTFNGILFDVPFLLHHFKNLKISSIHIDLRFLSKRVGLTGGQKEIERSLGIQRPIDFLEVSGEAAPILWFKYCRGDLNALQKLISYNILDIEGMKLIFDAVVEKLVQHQGLPHKMHPVYKFSTNEKLCTHIEETLQGFVSNLHIVPYIGEVGPRARWEDLNVELDISELRVVGIDLSGSEGKPSGWCWLHGNNAITRRIATDEDLIQATTEARPHLVSIDSPLSLPKGRTTVNDDDPGRKTFGITRYCERVLRQRGINVYPCLIKSMQKLTARGMSLAAHLRGLGVPVIESYPGAAQDILGIPRKGNNHIFLKQGLVEFGIRGNYVEKEVSHDELDAITSAIVGAFFWVGKFEALGDMDEEHLIIPKLDVDNTSWRTRRVFGLSGAIASGKTTAGTFLKSQQFYYTRFSLILADILLKQGVEPNRRSLQEFGEEVNKHLGQRWLCWQLAQSLPDTNNIVIDGLRFPEDRAFLIEKYGPGFLHIHLDSPITIRRERYLSKGAALEDFITAVIHPVEAGVTRLAPLADIVITNNGTMENFLSSIASLVYSA
jgi:uncharacterized protein YprB with RNaseH-like and TPR domain/predicted nuclease with RNAse H fold/dephospho-CoA kinase